MGRAAVEAIRDEVVARAQISAYSKLYAHYMRGRSNESPKMKTRRIHGLPDSTNGPGKLRIESHREKYKKDV